MRITTIIRRARVTRKVRPDKIGNQTIRLGIQCEVFGYCGQGYKGISTMMPLADPFILRLRNRMLDVRPFPVAKPLVMGILNVTPDSFSDGGDFVEKERAVDRAFEMIDLGADLIDIGGESSRPKGSVYGEGAHQLSVGEEIARIVPVIQRIIARDENVLISVDTYKPAVARAALQEGASLVNDITALRFAPELARVAAEFDAPLVMMHSLGNPGEMPHTFSYENVVGEVVTALQEAVRVAERAGVKQVILDPGFGFGKTSRDNLRLLNELDRLLELNRPILIGISRKSTIGRILGTTEDPVGIQERLFGTLGATAVAVLRGASIVRTHDVRETREFLELMFATVNPDSTTE